jgi:hypothetical protein
MSSVAASLSLPPEIALFPLNGVLLLPRGELPLNIFEPRYVAMVDDALRGDRMIGMIQPRAFGVENPPLFDVGCAGRITSFEETGDGRYLITLTGVSRFSVTQETAGRNGYRRARADWGAYAGDLQAKACVSLDRAKLKKLLGVYFEQHGIACDWGHIDSATDEKLINCLSMICPFDAAEKQVLLEAACCDARAEKFMAMLEMAVKAGGCCGGHCH